MSELEIDLELFAVHFALTGSGDSPRVGIFRRHPERIFQWEENRSVPAENNMSERGVRRTVIARKVCGGSRSNDALLVREVLQSVIESLRLRCADPVAKLTEALDAEVGQDRASGVD